MASYNELCRAQRQAYFAWQAAPAGSGDSALEAYLAASVRLNTVPAHRPAVQAFEDVTGYAPPAERWHAYDTDTYDGAPDAGRQIVGTGPTAAAALEDFYAQAEEG